MNISALLTDSRKLIYVLGGAIAIIYILKKLFGSAFLKSLFITEKIKEIGDKLKEEIDRLLTPEEDK